MTATLTQNLMDSLQALERLMMKALDDDQLAHLEAQRKTLSDELQRLIDEQVAEDTAAYKAANEKMAKAVKALKEALEDQAKAAKAITAIAKGVDFASKVAGRAVGAG